VTRHRNAMTTSRYIHGTDPAEQARLSLLNDLLNASCLRELSLSGGERILDVGAGLGQLSRAMARAAGRAVVGIERSEEQLARARSLAAEAGEEGLVELRRGDALSFPLEPAEWGSFDLAHARFILEHVPAPERVVEQMVRAVRPGGRVVLCDDDHSLFRLFPEPPGFRAVFGAFVRSYDRNGNDPFVGRRLVALLSGAGARPRRFTWVSIACCAGEESFAGLVENVAGNLRGARDAIVATGAVGAGEVDAALAALAEFARRPDATIGYAFSWAEGLRPGA
jgi:SAM-dependent methyltransferase